MHRWRGEPGGDQRGFELGSTCLGEPIAGHERLDERPRAVDGRRINFDFDAAEPDGAVFTDRDGRLIDGNFADSPGRVVQVIDLAALVQLEEQRQRITAANGADDRAARTRRRRWRGRGRVERFCDLAARTDAIRRRRHRFERQLGGIAFAAQPARVAGAMHMPGGRIEVGVFHVLGPDNRNGEICWQLAREPAHHWPRIKRGILPFDFQDVSGGHARIITANGELRTTDGERLASAAQAWQTRVTPGGTRRVQNSPC